MFCVDTVNKTKFPDTGSLFTGYYIDLYYNIKMTLVIPYIT